ncbi:MAG: hypothetical protein KGJ86_08750, partial [Chloroflexota bacterium]|nr:hypothetical protein [Chloroflexota bacterium]
TDGGGARTLADRFIPAEYADWCRQAIVVPAPAPDPQPPDPGLGTRDPGPETPDPRLDLVQRFAANHGPFREEALRGRYGFDPQPALEELANRRVLVKGAFTPGQSGEEWCLLENLRQLHRHTLAILREQIEPREPAQYAAFLTEWQHLAPRPALSGVAGLRKVIGQLQGLPLPMEAWEPDVLHRRLSGYQPAWLDQLCASGEIVWIGSTTAGGGKGKIAFYFRDELEALLPLEGPPRSPSDTARRARDWLHARGASFLQDIAAGAGLSLPHTYDALWELVWAGEATNDTFDPVRSPRRPQAESRVSGPGSRVAGPESQGSKQPVLGGASPRRWSYRRDFRRPGAGVPAGQGRWSLLAPGQLASPEEQAEAYARQLLARYGVVAREMALAEEGPAPWAAVYGVLKRLEAIGQVRRGYFVKGLSGAQFALPEAVEQLRKPREQRILLNAADPANPYGAILPSEGDRRVTRLASNYLVLADGQPALAIEGQGKDLRPLGASAGAALALLPAILDVPARLRRIKRLEVETWDGQPILASPVRQELAQLGFDADPQRMVLRPRRL